MAKSKKGRGKKIGTSTAKEISSEVKAAQPCLILKLILEEVDPTVIDNNSCSATIHTALMSLIECLPRKSIILCGISTLGNK